MSEFRTGPRIAETSPLEKSLACLRTRLLFLPALFMPLAALSAGLPQSQNRADTIYLPAPCGHRLQGTINEKQGQWLLDTLHA